MNSEITRESQADLDEIIAGAVENRTDEEMIVLDQDQTDSQRSLDTAPFYSQPKSSRYIEDEPDAFVEGEIDVVEQMRRTTRQMQTAIEGHDSALPLEMQSEETQAAYESTPGGLEEVFNKTDQDLIEKKHYHI